MEESVKKETPEGDSLWKRLFAWFSAVLLLAFLICLSATYTRQALAPSSIPLWMRLPLFLAPAMMALLAVWFVYRFVQIQSKEAAIKAGRPYQMSPRAAFWSGTDEWLLPLMVSIFAFGIAFSFFAMALKLPIPRDFVWFRNSLLVSAALFLLISTIWPIRAIRRKRKSGSFLPSQQDIAATREPKPLWKRRLAAGLWSLFAIFITFSAILGHRDRLSNWALAVLALALAAWSIWELFRPNALLKSTTEATEKPTEV